MNKLLKEIYKAHIRKLKNLDKINKKKLLICFSAVPGSGKTYISKKLERKFKAVRINNDDIRDIISEINPRGDTQKILLRYLKYLLNNYNFSNNLLVLDSSIDRKYELVKRLSKKNKFKILLIRIISDEKTVKKLIKRRNGSKSKGYFDNMSRWIKENNNFNKKIKADFIIYNKNQQLDLKALYSLINNNGKHKQKLVR